MYITTIRDPYEQLASSDVELRIKNSRVGLLSWAHEANLRPAPSEQIARVCDTEIGLLEGLRDLSPEQQVAVDLLMHRWRDLADQARKPPQRPQPARAYARRRRA